MPRVVPSQVVELIDEMFGPLIELERLGRVEPTHRGAAAQVEAMVALASEIPSELISLHGADYSAYVAALATLRNALREWESRDSPLKRVLHQHPIVLLRRLLARCPDETISPGTTELPFIDDEQLRDSIRRDLAAANAALLNGEWKAATVLAGSACEALLLWRTLKAAPADREEAARRATHNGVLNAPPQADPQAWVLHQLIEVAAELRAITEPTRDQLRLAKDFRNLIHPGRAQRVGQVCDRGTALSAIAGLEHAIRDLSR